MEEPKDENKYCNHKVNPMTNTISSLAGGFIAIAIGTVFLDRFNKLG